MKLVDAIRIATTPAPDERDPFRVLLWCAFTPLHLRTYLAAHLRAAVGGRPVTVDTAQYGSEPASLATIDVSSYQVVCAVIEWPDLDPRLGYRQLGGWGPSLHGDVVRTVSVRLRQLETVLAAVAERRPIAFAGPTLPLPPIGFTVGAHASSLELELRAVRSSFEQRLLGIPQLFVVSTEFLEHRSPVATRLDLKSELLSGFPYRVPHADALGEALARLAAPPVPKKGLITDLDDTVWHGLVGEVGPSAVTFDLESGTQIHGVYQQFLASLAEAGALIAIASRNDADVVRIALERSDLLLTPESLFPVEAHWEAKTESISRILAVWNVAPDAVVVIDDSDRELEEIRRAFPAIECRSFPGASRPDKVLELLRELRDLFGRPRLTEEDAIRAATVRAAANHPDDLSGVTEEIIAGAGAELTVDWNRARGDGRSLELVNKTNQFNLNGRRYTAAEWDDATSADDVFLMTIAYADRFGPLGRIAIIAGRKRNDLIEVTTWVMSCRAFARRIEHRCLALLFDLLGATRIQFDFAVTPRNAPLRQFFGEMVGREPSGPFILERAEFEARRPELHQRVSVNG